MLNILSKIVHFNTLSILGIFRKDEADVYELIVIKKKKKKIDIIYVSDFDDYNTALKSINNNLPLLLVVDGKGILNKKIDLKNEKDIQWKKNLDYSTIYFIDYTIAGSTFMSFGRKSTIDEYITDLKRKKIQVIDFYMGPLASVLLQPVIKSNRILSNETLLEFDNNALNKISKSSELKQNYTFDGTTLSQYQVPLFGAGVAFILNTKEIKKNNSGQLAREEIIYKKSFDILGIIILIAFFTALLVSYMSIQYYSAQNIKLLEKDVFLNETHLQIEKLEAQKASKLNILTKSGQLSKHFLSYYAYELLKSVPVQITINQLDILPLSKEIKENEKVNIESNIITIKGTSAIEESFEEWLHELRRMPWIKKFEVISLKKDKKDIQQFEIKIILNDF
jgi:hypothetical protein